VVALVTQNEIIALIAVGLGSIFFTRGAFTSTDVRAFATQNTQVGAFQEIESLGMVSAQESLGPPQRRESDLERAIRLGTAGTFGKERAGRISAILAKFPAGQKGGLFGMGPVSVSQGGKCIGGCPEGGFGQPFEDLKRFFGV